MGDREPHRGRDRQGAQGERPDPQEVARTGAGGQGDETPPGGDVRTVYTDDRDPGEAEPETPQPS